MKTKYILIFILVAILIAFLSGYIQIDLSKSENIVKQQAIQNVPKPINCIPTFADGGGPYYKQNSPFRNNIAPENNNGEKLIVRGKVLKNDCITPVANAVLDIWQANETGNYQDEWYRGQVRTDDQGNYFF